MDADKDIQMTDVDLTEVQKFDKGPRRFQRRRQRERIPPYIDWKDTDYLRKFVPERGKIMPRRISQISAKDQRRLAKAIKRARSMALLSFVGD